MVDENDNLTVDIDEVIEGTLVEKPVAIATRLTEIQKVYGDDRPYNEEQVIQEALFFRQQSLESLLEFGKRLVWIKENAEHGHFIKILDERFGMERRAAARIMQACVKLSNGSDPTHLIKAVQNKAKLFELMILDDSELDALGQGKTVAGIELSDIEKMTSTELRRALKKSKEETEAARRVSDQKDDKINELSEENTKLEMQNKKEAKKRIELPEDARIRLIAGYKESWLGVSTQFTTAMCDTKSLLAQAESEELPHHFYQQIAAEITDIKLYLEDILLLLPHDLPTLGSDEWGDDVPQYNVEKEPS